MTKVGNLLIGVSLANVRFGSKADMTLSSRHVCFTPESGHRSRRRNVRFVPEADISRLNRSPRRLFCRYPPRSGLWSMLK
jgi:hypothetical protein